MLASGQGGFLRWLTTGDIGARSRPIGSLTGGASGGLLKMETLLESGPSRLPGGRPGTSPNHSSQDDERAKDHGMSVRCSFDGGKQERDNTSCEQQQSFVIHNTAQRTAATRYLLLSLTGSTAMQTLLKEHYEGLMLENLWICSDACEPLWRPASLFHPLRH